ncbi:hypothetical protein [Beijerinckia indica]|uniref:Phosphoglycerate mutase n=1 Tax=Beijerinckia indica subsp. indica (strain ATCC 9039 / DSM 1715 / NCIMB 8712) TaxID=395963 RepID=B2IHJ3_BEII9|nr:hypothetical protein [Beijerinckia indica]ACB94514.1 conserved hypothetical protein [Beijerinckia indica subsp. indica ATCC 9039]
MPASKIMLIRHSEKPGKDPAQLPPVIRGVAPDGTKSKDSLSVRGWQRAGALVRFFDPLPEKTEPESAIARPSALFACKALPTNSSLRPQQTLWPLSDFLKVPVNVDFAEGEEQGLVEVARGKEGVVLISWKHNKLPTIANLILGDTTTAPQKWPIDHFSTVWVFDRGDQGWSFRQVPQRLLAEDPETVI